MVSNQAAEFWNENGIGFGRFKPGIFLDLELARQCVELRRSIFPSQKIPFLMDICGLNGITKEARDYLGSAHGTGGINVGALLTNKTLFNRTNGNIFFRLSRPQIPHRMFGDRQKAIKWLSKYKTN